MVPETNIRPETNCTPLLQGNTDLWCFPGPFSILPVPKSLQTNCNLQVFPVSLSCTHQGVYESNLAILPVPQIDGLDQVHRLLFGAESDGSEPVQAQNKQYRTEIASHQAQLEALKQQDPEFYQYLQQTDQELLNFGQDDDEDEDDDEEEQEEEGDVESVSDQEQVDDL